MNELLECSVTHAGILVGVAVSRTTQLGLDAEEVRPPYQAADTIARYALSPKEQLFVSLQEVDSRPELLYRAWVRKEASLKAAGLGLLGEPRTVNVLEANLMPLQDLSLGGDRTTSGIYLQDLEVPLPFMASLATTSRHLALEIRYEQLSAWRDQVA
jgi:4'-phosphopantetheinyl transferase